MGNDEKGLCDRLSMRHLDKNKIRLIALFGCFLSVLFACNQSPDMYQTPRSIKVVEKVSDDGSALTVSPIMALPVHLKVPESEDNDGENKPGLSLVLNPTQISLSITGCSSGYDVTGLLYNGTGIELYTADRNCQIGVVNFQHGGEQFDIATGYTFDYAEGAMTLFESSP
ncbi:MAG: hypothetical protein HRU09_20010 [Oligoflexales bacterium]|nr:hypothetical protein [Oligoflexales bacterium]